MRGDRHPDNIERAQELNRIACNHISDGNLKEAKDSLIEAIRIAPNLAALHTNLGVPTAWCEIVD